MKLIQSIFFLSIGCSSSNDSGNSSIETTETLGEIQRTTTVYPCNVPKAYNEDYVSDDIELDFDNPSNALIGYNREIFLFPDDLYLADITETDFVKSLVFPINADSEEWLREDGFQRAYCGWSEPLDLDLDGVEYLWAYFGDITRVVIE